MSRLVARSTALIRRFARARRGAIAVEFAIIGIPLMMLIFGVLELALILLVTATLDTATDFATRSIRTGRFQAAHPNQTSAQQEVSKREFGKLVCRNMSWLRDRCEDKLIVDAETFDTFADVKNSNSITPGNFTTSPPTCWSVGGPKDIVLMRVYYQWDLITPLLNATMVNMGGGKRLLVSATAFLNEPYDPTLSKVGAKC